MGIALLFFFLLAAITSSLPLDQPGGNPNHRIQQGQTGPFVLVTQNSWTANQKWNLIKSISPNGEGAFIFTGGQKNVDKSDDVTVSVTRQPMREEEVRQVD
jgi:hypothetical protein